MAGSEVSEVLRTWQSKYDVGYISAEAMSMSSWVARSFFDCGLGRRGFNVDLETGWHFQTSVQAFSPEDMAKQHQLPGLTFWWPGTHRPRRPDPGLGRGE